ncbi:MAG: hypothetical protein ABSE04_04230 [Candidatus Microgenomates bacterium]
MGEGPNSLGPGAVDPKARAIIADAVRRINEEYQQSARQFSSTVTRVTGTAEADRAAGQMLKPPTSFMKKGSRG